MSSDELKPVTQSQRVLLALGTPAILFGALLAGRIVWEETVLTLQQGPQMVGFSLAHGAGAVLLLAPLFLLLWLLSALIVFAASLWHKKSLSKWFFSFVAAAIVVLVIVLLPPVFWQWLFIGNFAKSAYASELMTYSAAEGNLRTVSGYLRHGVPLEAINYEGSTSAFTAAAGGSVPVLEMLSSKGANLNATNLYGDSPLEVALENHHESAAAFLKAHGAMQIRGTPEQHQAASESIVRKQIERMNAH